MKLKRFVILLFILFSCDPHDGKLKIINNSDKPICYSFSDNNDSIFESPFVNGNEDINYVYSNCLSPNEQISDLNPQKWENYINRRCKDSTYRIFFFTKKLIDSLGFEEIQRRKVFSKQVVVKVKDLEKMNWIVEYKE